MRLTCIIPAYNEGKRIASVLRAVVAHPQICEVIVVDDGSTDNTRSECAQFDSVRVIARRRNQGKSRAVSDGIRASRGSSVLLLDADLLGLSQQNLTDLIAPVASGEADCSFSLRRNALLPFRLIGLDYVSGERVLSRDLLASKVRELEKLPGFGLEVFTNQLLLERRSRIKVVHWKNVVNPTKRNKRGFEQGIADEVRMLKQILQTISIFEALSQIAGLLRARV